MSLLGISRPPRAHRAVDEVVRLRHLLARAHAGLGLMRRQLDAATAGWDTANAKVSQLGEIEAQLAETTQRADAFEAEARALRSQLANARKVSGLAAHPAVAETQPIPVVVPLHLSPLAGTAPSHLPGL
ncbi:hypothetical protein ACIQU4_15335 [Streptomyces sp. NPDC090741]|uniref:hypothetical protein n=1 Tax=Streptomyces sp. NPDC090741 TaxID=3365967 RepID=UPI003806EE7A